MIHAAGYALYMAKKNGCQCLSFCICERTKAEHHVQGMIPPAELGRVTILSGEGLACLDKSELAVMLCCPSVGLHWVALPTLRGPVIPYTPSL